MTKQELVKQIREKKSFLCVGLDTDISKIPAEYLKEEDPIFAFNKAVIDATADLAVAYKPNLAFYEAEGVRGLQALQKTIEYIPKNIFTIADAKRGDIGNTTNQYAKAFFETMGFDSITLSPYMGADSIEPYLKYPNKWAIVLGVTSNPGAMDFQFQVVDEASNTKLYQKVIDSCNDWGSDENIMFVVGATRADVMQKVRAHAPNHFFLVPGVGAQGGSLKDVCENGMNKDIGLLINSSRGIIYANHKATHAESVRAAALKIQQEMEAFL